MLKRSDGKQCETKSFRHHLTEKSCQRKYFRIWISFRLLFQSRFMADIVGDLDKQGSLGLGVNLTLPLGYVVSVVMRRVAAETVGKFNQDEKS